MDSEFLEVHYEVAIAIESSYDNLGVLDRDPFEGKGGRWEKAEEWTKEFVEIHKNTDWTELEGMWFEMVEEFVNNKINSLS